MSRPAGVTLLGVLYIIMAIIYILSGIVGFLLTSPFGDLFGPTLIFSGAMAIVPIVIGIIDLVIGWGLLALKGWARILAIVFAILGLLGGLASLIVFPIGTIIGIIEIILSIIILWYLFKPEIASAFE
ncbi:MAG: DUF7144 family membrane protein [Candidatus Freyarchaeota archaeon]|nr:hypothetical protein [Candidatus Freyrarchaeum guaymaensis]